MNPPSIKSFRPLRVRRRVNRIALVAFFLFALEFSLWYGPADSERYRRLAVLHQAKAAQCHRLEGVARAADREDEAQILTRSAINHEWFSRAYRERARILVDQWTKFLTDW